jgi:hypothetical protein
MSFDSVALESLTSDEDVIKLLNSRGGQRILRDLTDSPNGHFSDSESVPSDFEEPLAAVELVTKAQAISQHSLFPKTLQNAIKRVTGFNVSFQSVEILDPATKPNAIWIEYTFPGYASENTQGRFRTKIPISPPRRQKAEKSVKLNHSVNISINFDDDSLKLWNEGLLEIKAIAIESQSGTALRPSKLLRSGKTDLWTCFGHIRCRNFLLASEMKWSGDIPLYLTNSKSQKLTDIQGSISLSVSMIFANDVIPEVNLAKAIQLPEAKRELRVNSPCYLFFHLGRTRALSVPGSMNASLSTLLFLRTRLFSNSNDVIETAPVSYVSSFGANSDLLGDSTNFDFGHTIPLALTQQFVDTSGRSPIIVEVNVVGSYQEEARSKETLLGLIRLPFHQLIGSMVSHFSSDRPTIYNMSNLQIPETEYVIKDPFTGDSKGWIKGFISIGNWEQVDALRRNFTVPLKASSSVSEAIKETQEKLEFIKSISSQVTNRRAESVPLAAETVVQVTIHGACGLSGLLSDYIRTCDESLGAALDYAQESGTNTYVRLNLFPRDVGEAKESLIETCIVASSFAPRYESEFDVMLQGIDTDLIHWIKDGGCAEGQLWHRIPSQLSTSSSVGQACLLGTFSVPLKRLLNCHSGITNQWFAIHSNPGQVNSRAAVELSLCFKDFDLGELGGSRSRSCAYGSIKLGINMENLQFEGIEVNDDDRLLAKWKFAKSDVLDWEYSDSAKVERRIDSIFNSTLSYNTHRQIDLSPEMERNFQTNSLEFEFLLVTTASQHYLGSAFVDASELFSATKCFERSRSGHPRPELAGRYKLINPTSIDLGNAGVDIRAHIEFSRTKSSHQKNALESEIRDRTMRHAEIADEPLCIEQLEPVEASLVESIPVNVAVEKAMNLPLVGDPLAPYIPSPFVPTHLTHTCLPNAVVTISLTSNESEVYHESHVAPSGTRPSWNFKETIMIPKHETHLAQWKEFKSVDFNVWHQPATRSGGTQNTDRARALIGTSKILLSPLFTGLHEIHGWYPITNDSRECTGHILVHIRPSEDLGQALSKLKGINFEFKNVVQGVNFSTCDIFDTMSRNTNKSQITTSFQPVRSISEAMYELDLLNSKMMQSISMYSDKDAQQSDIPDKENDFCFRLDFASQTDNGIIGEDQPDEPKPILSTMMRSTGSGGGRALELENIMQQDLGEIQGSEVVQGESFECETSSQEDNKDIVDAFETHYKPLEDAQDNSSTDLQPIPTEENSATIEVQFINTDRTNQYG